MEKAALQVCPARAEDEAEVYRLLCLLEEKDFDREGFSRRYQAALRESRVRLFTARGPDGTMGFLSLLFQRYLHHEGEVAEIGELVVDPASRGGGAGGALFAQAVRAAKSRGCETLEVHCGVFRGRAHAFYEGRGMTKTHSKFTMEL
ncbi:MAG: GNAT family N-acetyltransferase [Oscillospiraceae bacterium]|nr:GNAT family N-acetyltransferase [Oscillospiraceae bacterium]